MAHNITVSERIAVPPTFRVGPWLFARRLNTVSLAGRETRLELKVVDVFVCLAHHAGDVVSRDTLIHDVWGETFVTDASLTRCIAELRRVFDDDVREPRVIQTISKQGYRLIAPVTAASTVSPMLRDWLPAITAGLVVGMFAGCAAMWLRGRG